MGLSVHFWIVFQSVIFGEKFQLIYYFCTTEFLLRILLLLFPLLVSLLGIGYYYYYCLSSSDLCQVVLLPCFIGCNPYT